MMQTRSGPRRARTVTRVVAVAATAVIVLAGCRPASTTYEAQAKRAERFTPDKRPWFCNSTGQGTPPSGHGNGSHVHPIYAGKTKGPLSWEDCTKLAAELDQTVKAVKGFETKAKGEAAGWRQVAAYIPGLGTHHAKFPGSTTPGTTPGSTPGSTPGTLPSNDQIQRIVQCLKDKGVNLSGGLPDLSDPAVAAALQACGAPSISPGAIPGFGGPFDPAKPNFLIYGGPNPDAPLVGVAYAFFGSSTPPEAYTGGNDWWHLHSKICIGPDREILAGAEEISDAQCAALGGTQRNLAQLPGVPAGSSSGIWLLHVWMVQPYEYRPDIFVSGHPCLVASGVLPQSDPCWATAHRDPSAAPPPGPTPTVTTMPGDPGDHGDHGDH
jgi:hypothetical protein